MSPSTSPSNARPVETRSPHQIAYANLQAELQETETKLKLLAGETLTVSVPEKPGSEKTFPVEVSLRGHTIRIAGLGGEYEMGKIGAEARSSLDRDAKAQNARFKPENFVHVAESVQEELRKMRTGRVVPPAHEVAGKLSTNFEGQGISTVTLKADPNSGTPEIKVDAIPGKKGTPTQYRAQVKNVVSYDFDADGNVSETTLSTKKRSDVEAPTLRGVLRTVNAALIDRAGDQINALSDELTRAGLKITRAITREIKTELGTVSIRETGSSTEILLSTEGEPGKPVVTYAQRKTDRQISQKIHVKGKSAPSFETVLDAAIEAAKQLPDATPEKADKGSKPKERDVVEAVKHGIVSIATTLGEVHLSGKDGVITLEIPNVVKFTRSAAGEVTTEAKQAIHPTYTEVVEAVANAIQEKKAAEERKAPASAYARIAQAISDAKTVIPAEGLDVSLPDGKSVKLLKEGEAYIIRIPGTISYTFSPDGKTNQVFHGIGGAEVTPDSLADAVVKALTPAEKKDDKGQKTSAEDLAALTKLDQVLRAAGKNIGSGTAPHTITTDAFGDVTVGRADGAAPAIKVTVPNKAEYTIEPDGNGSYKINSKPLGQDPVPPFPAVVDAIEQGLKPKVHPLVGDPATVSAANAKLDAALQAYGKDLVKEAVKIQHDTLGEIQVSRSGDIITVKVGDKGSFVRTADGSVSIHGEQAGCPTYTAAVDSIVAGLEKQKQDAQKQADLRVTAKLVEAIHYGGLVPQRGEFIVSTPNLGDVRLNFGETSATLKLADGSSYTIPASDDSPTISAPAGVTARPYSEVVDQLDSAIRNQTLRLNERLRQALTDLGHDFDSGPFTVQEGPFKGVSVAKNGENLLITDPGKVECTCSGADGSATLHYLSTDHKVASYPELAEGIIRAIESQEQEQDRGPGTDPFEGAGRITDYAARGVGIDYRDLVLGCAVTFQQRENGFWYATFKHDNSHQISFCLGGSKDAERSAVEGIFETAFADFLGSNRHAHGELFEVVQRGVVRINPNYEQPGDSDPVRQLFSRELSGVARLAHVKGITLDQHFKGFAFIEAPNLILEKVSCTDGGLDLAHANIAGGEIIDCDLPHAYAQGADLRGVLIKGRTNLEGLNLFSEQEDGTASIAVVGATQAEPHRVTSIDRAVNIKGMNVLGVSGEIKIALLDELARNQTNEALRKAVLEQLKDFTYRDGEFKYSAVLNAVSYDLDQAGIDKARGSICAAKLMDQLISAGAVRTELVPLAPGQTSSSIFGNIQHGLAKENHEDFTSGAGNFAALIRRREGDEDLLLRVETLNGEDERRKSKVTLLRRFMLDGQEQGYTRVSEGIFSNHATMGEVAKFLRSSGSDFNLPPTPPRDDDRDDGPQGGSGNIRRVGTDPSSALASTRPRTLSTALGGGGSSANPADPSGAPAGNPFGGGAPATPTRVVEPPEGLLTKVSKTLRGWGTGLSNRFKAWRSGNRSGAAPSTQTDPDAE